jgi:hypothetical protein
MADQTILDQIELTSGEILAIGKDQWFLGAERFGAVDPRGLSIEQFELAIQDAIREPFEDSITALDVRMTAAESSLVPIPNQLTVLQIALDTAEATLAPLPAEITAIDGRVTTLEAVAPPDVSALETRVDDAEAALIVVDTRLGTAETELANLDGRLLSAEGTLSPIPGQVTAVEATAVAHDARLDTAEADLLSLDGRLDTAEGTLTPIPAQITAIGTDITALQTDVTTLQTDVLSRVRFVSNVAALETAAPLDGELFMTLGYTTAGDGGANLYRYDVASVATVDSGWVIDGPSSVGRYLAVDTSVANVRRFGAFGDGTTDDTAAIQAAIDAATSARLSIAADAGGSTINRRISPAVRFPLGTYVTSAPLIFDNDVDPVNIEGNEAILLADAGFTGSYAIEIGGTTLGVGNISIKGLHLLGYPNGIRCGESPNNYSMCQIVIDFVRFIGATSGTGLYIYNRSANAVISNCQFDAWIHAVISESCDIVHFKDCRFVIKSYEDESTRPDYDGYVILNTGKIVATDCVFTPSAIYSGTKPVSWFYVTDPASPSGTHSTQCELRIERGHFGGESGGLTTVIWDAEPTDASPAVPTVVSVENSFVGNNRQIGPGLFSPVVALAKIPNILSVKSNYYNSNRNVAAEYIEGAVAPTPWYPTATKALYVNCRDNAGGSSIASLITPDWVPSNLAVSTIPDGDTTPSVAHANETTVLKFANTSPTNVTNFDTETSGKRFPVFVDTNTTLVHSGGGLKLVGATNFTPGAGGALMTFLNIAGVWHEMTRTSF